MINVNKNIVKTGMPIVIIVLVMIVAYIVNVNNNYKVNLNTANAKNKLLKVELQKEVVTRSDIEILEFRATESGRFAKDRLIEISEYETKIKTIQGLYELDILTKACNEEQIKRKINGLEYNLKYCLDESNLEQYRTKKY